MGSKTICVLAEKGGVGKTTTVLELASILGEDGQKVLVIDLDPQANTTLQLSRTANNTKGIYDVFDQETKITLKDVLRKTDHKKVILAPADRRLLKLAMILESRVARDFVLKKSLVDAYSYFDYILIDTPPALGVHTVNALAASDYYLTVTDFSEYSRVSIEQVEKLAQIVKESVNQTLKCAGILVTAYQKGGSFGVRDFIRSLERDFANKLLKEIKIPHTTKILEAQREFKALSEVFPTNPASVAYRSLSAHIQSL